MCVVKSPEERKNQRMKDLIEALQIMSKYMDADEYSPTHCEHDSLYVLANPSNVSPEDTARLAELGFRPEGDTFRSYRFGSA